MVDRLISVGDDLTLPPSVKATDANLPTRLGAAALSATYGNTYRPEAYGAVGDGVADDLPAFRAIEAAINADPTTPAKIEVTGVHYVSNGINFDGEDIECYLAAGSHIFTKAATNVGHTLGFIGYLGSGTAVAPYRRRVKIHGPGKVTGWLGAAPSTAGNNENAIGVVRYWNVEIDGPQELEAGNKAFTAQYGIGHVKVRNLGVKRANFRAISVEDGTLTADIDGLVSESAGGAAVVCSAEKIRYRNLDIGSANTNGGATEAAVRATGVGTDIADIDDIRIDDAGVGKGIIVANASELVHVGSNVSVGASAGNAVELQNCTGSIYVGVIDAPASLARLGVAGTTSAVAVKRIGQPDPTEITVSATRFNAVTGSPVVGMAGPQLPGFLLDSTAAEAVAALLGRDVIPASWKTFAVDIVWTNTTTNAGDVRHDASHGWLGSGDAFSTGTYVSGAAQAAPTAFGTMKTTRLIASITADATKNLYLRVIRNGGDATDTLVNDSGLVAVKLVRLS